MQKDFCKRLKKKKKKGKKSRLHERIREKC